LAHVQNLEGTAWRCGEHEVIAVDGVGVVLFYRPAGSRAATVVEKEIGCRVRDAILDKTFMKAEIVTQS